MDLEGLFFKKGAKSEEPKKPTKSTSAGVAVSAPAFTPNVAQQFNTTVVDQNNNIYIEYIKKEFEAANFPGPDYQEYMSGVDSVQNLAVDEATKFKMVFAGFAVQKVTKDQLVKTAKQYIELIKKAITNFNAEIDNMLNSEVGKKQSQVETLIKENEELELKMQELTDRKNKNFVAIQNLSVEIQNETMSLQSKRNGFESAANSFIGKIDKDIQKIEQHL